MRLNGTYDRSLRQQTLPAEYKLDINTDNNGFVLEISDRNLLPICRHSKSTVCLHRDDLKRKSKESVKLWLELIDVGENGL